MSDPRIEIANAIVRINSELPYLGAYNVVGYMLAFFRNNNNALDCNDDDIMIRFTVPSNSTHMTMLYGDMVIYSGGETDILCELRASGELLLAVLTMTQDAVRREIAQAERDRVMNEILHRLQH